jgi:intracellular sulfur oxidation DsrE/DsrF family protein
MNCQQLHRLIHAYVDQELDLMTSLDLESHLKDCGDCRARHITLRSLRDIEVQHLQFHAAPESLKTRITRDLRATCPNTPGPQLRAWRASSVVMTLSLVALLAWVALPATSPNTSRVAASASEKMVYHIANSTEAFNALRNVSNHLAVSPHAKVVVVAHNQGVDFLLRDAKDSDGSPYETAVAQLASRGVEFRICQNTLTRRHVGTEAVISNVRLVPSGIAEISRLQTQEGYAYMRL